MIFKIFVQEAQVIHDIFRRFKYLLIDFLQKEVFVFAGDFPGMIDQAVTKRSDQAVAFL